MTKENKNRITELYIKKFKSTHPNVPDHAIPIPKYSDSSTNKLTKCVKEFIVLSGYQAERINSAGRYIDGKKRFVDVLGMNRSVGSGKWVPGTTTPGSADVSAVILGRAIKIEIKFGKDKLSEAQERYRDSIESAGGVYIVAKTFDGFIEWYDQFINKIKNYA